jgi:DNA repair protein RadA/Sms
MVVWEGSRPLLVEIQALVDYSQMGNARRVAVGLDQNRLAMLLAVLHRHGNVQMNDQDDVLGLMTKVNPKMNNQTYH